MNFLSLSLSAGAFASAGGFFESFFDRYFKRTLEDYENLSVGEGALPLSIIIGGIILGVIGAFFFMTVYKKTVCAFVDDLLLRGAVGEENAVSLSELAVSKGILKRIKNSSALRRTVIVVEKDDNGEPSYDPRIYIAEDKKYFAQTHFETKGASWGRFAIITVACIIGYFLLMELVPSIIGVVDGFIGSF